MSAEASDDVTAQEPTPGWLAASTVAVVGLGLLGGSLAAALEGRCRRRVGVVRPGDHETARLALASGVVDEVQPLAGAVAGADVVVLAAPVRSIIAMLPDVAASARPGTLVTDVGGSKSAIVEAMREAASSAPGVLFVGGHPMCGGTTRGLSAIDAGMFTGARWALCALEEHAAPLALDHACDLVRTVGAEPLVTPAAEHDRAVALVSHAPRVLATSLAETLAGRPGGDRELATALAGRGWAGATRLALGDAQMWSDAIETNAAQVAAVARELAGRLRDVANELDHANDR